jgi:hypothetical protein
VESFLRYRLSETVIASLKLVQSPLKTCHSKKKRVGFSEWTGRRALSFRNLLMEEAAGSGVNRKGYVYFFCIRTRRFALNLLSPDDPVPRITSKETPTFLLPGYFIYSSPRDLICIFSMHNSMGLFGIKKRYT